MHLYTKLLTCIQYICRHINKCTYAFTGFCSLFELIDLLLLKYSISECTTAAKQIGVHHLKCYYLVSLLQFENVCSKIKVLL